ISQFMETRSKGSDQADKQPIFVAMTDVAPNEELTAQNLKLEEWPKNIVPAGALTKLEDVEGKRCRIKLYAGEPILSSKLLGEHESLGAAKEIPEGMRIVHVDVDSSAGGNNLILPGDRVDVLVFRQPGSDMHTTVSKIVLQDIKVFAVDTHTETEFSRNNGDSSEPISAKAIALLVTPQQAVILHAATKIGGAVRLVLRNPNDNEQVVSQGASVGDIFGSDQRWEQKRDSEEEKTGKEDLSAYLNQQKAESFLKKDEASAEPPAVPSAPAAPARKMIVLYGSELQEVDFAENGTLLSNPFKKDGIKSFNNSPTQLTGEKEVQAPATVGEADSTKDNDDFISPE
ncbi:MAG TPA: Flp pilus assembly protein CpaB, partial [Pirellulales bacterium]|nr:Flp pilus assembly protein CpaB [Pirellulales bacterium]